MGLHQQFLSLIGFGPADREVIAGLRDQIIEMGTHLRFLEADRPVPQPRDDAGRFVSKRDIVRQQLEVECAGKDSAHFRNVALTYELPPLTPEQRTQFKDRASRRERG